MFTWWEPLICNVELNSSLLCFHKCIFMYCMKMYLPSEVWMKLWSKCVSVHTFYVENSFIGQKHFGYYFLCQLQRPVVKLDSVELVIHTTHFPRSFDQYWHFDSWWWWLSYESLWTCDFRSTEITNRRRTTENLMKCTVSLWCSIGTVTQVGVTAQKITAEQAVPSSIQWLILYMPVLLMKPFMYVIQW